MTTFLWILFTVGGFLLGGIMFCEIIPKLVLHKDIYAISVDNNPGAFNVFKHCGKKVGIPCLLLDVLKGFIPVLLASLLMDANSIAFSFVMVAPALGHAIGLFNHFHGGKCIAVSFGIMFGLIPVTWIGIVALAALYILFSTAIKIKNSAKRSVVVYGLFMLITCTVLGVIGLTYAAIGCGLVAIMPIVRFLFTKNGLVDNKFVEEDVVSENVIRG
ncbi:MAG: glycerol-3-phosphate acyltransferase [Clostridia bacterium]|nr:glycerol-3-phosphate acyltransferase [Clostridia bacterium]